MTQTPEWSKVKVLVADDEVHIREIVSTWFGRLGCAVDQAANGRAALELLARNSHDILISDVRMPGGDGTRLVTDLKTRGIELPVVFITGYADLPLDEVYDIGVHAILQKPCPRTELIASVERCLQAKTHVWTSAPPATTSMLRRQFDSMELALQSGMLAFGQGGFFLAGGEDHYPGQSLAFELVFSAGDIPAFSGTGRIRWQRSECPDTMAGIGVEILTLDPQSISWMLNRIRTCRPSSYIPRGPSAVRN